MAGPFPLDAMAPLENPAESPCFGCGPQHPRGLHLVFDRRTAPDGADEVVCQYAAKPDEIGWPGLMHIGLLFMVMMETSYWAALTLGGRVHAATGPMSFEPLRLPRVGRPFRAAARIVGREGVRLRIACVAEDAVGKTHATMTSGWQPATRSAAERAGLSLPSYLLEDMDP